MLSRKAIRMMTDRARNCQRKLDGLIVPGAWNGCCSMVNLGSTAGTLLQQVDGNELETTNNRC
jgi:hypothetical protein